MKTIRTLVISPNAPDTNSVWLNKGTAKYFNNGMWQTIGGVGSVDWDDIENKPTEFYILPAATPTTLGGVKKATNVTALTDLADVAKVAEKVNAILSALKVADIMVKDAN